MNEFQTKDCFTQTVECRVCKFNNDKERDILDIGHSGFHNTQEHVNC